MNIFRWFRRRRFGLGEYSRFSGTFRSRGDRVTSRDQTVLRAGLAAARVKFTADREAAAAVRSLPGRIARLRDKAYGRSQAAGRALDLAVNIGLVLGVAAVVVGAYWWLPALGSFVWALLIGLWAIVVALATAVWGALVALVPFILYGLAAVAAGIVIVLVFRAIGGGLRGALSGFSSWTARRASRAEDTLATVRELDRELNGSGC